MANDDKARLYRRLLHEATDAQVVASARIPADVVMEVLDALEA